jgi:hypothetical protein
MKVVGRSDRQFRTPILGPLPLSKHGPSVFAAAPFSALHSLSNRVWCQNMVCGAGFDHAPFRATIAPAPIATPVLAVTLRD